jgi:hypothetical protein
MTFRPPTFKQFKCAENEDAVGAYKMSMTTVPGLAFNLFPERSLYEQGYIISKDINGDSSMTKYDSAGVVVHRIPIFYDAENAHHVIHMAVSRTKNTEQLTKLVHKTSATVQNMYASPPKSRGYDAWVLVSVVKISAMMRCLSSMTFWSTLAWCRVFSTSRRMPKAMSSVVSVTSPPIGVRIRYEDAVRRLILWWWSRREVV